MENEEKTPAENTETAPAEAQAEPVAEPAPAEAALAA